MDIETTCRTCLGILDPKTKFVFDDVIVCDEYSVSLKKILNSICLLNISSTNNLPNGICSECMEKTTAICLFQKLCLESEDFWQSFSNNGKNKKDFKSSSPLMELEQSVPIDEIDIHNSPSVSIGENLKDESASNLDEKFKYYPEITEQFEIISEDTEELIKEDDEEKIKYHCEVCDKVFNGHMNYYGHMSKTKHYAKCKRCADRCFETFMHFEVHRILCQTSGLPVEMSCPICLERFSDYITIDTHWQSKHPEDPIFICECSAVFNTKRKLKDHYTTHMLLKKFSCPKCSKVYMKKESFEQHMDDEHNGSYVCTVCNKTFHCQRNLKIHSKTHTDYSERNYKCRYCNKMFNQLHHKQNHERVHTGYKPFLCDLCGIGFKQRHRLTVHMRKHSAGPTFDCDICTKQFISERLLGMHMRAHGIFKALPARVFGCNICHSRFATDKLLKRHKIEEHSTSYWCVLCGADFKKRSILWRHLTDYHDLDDLDSVVHEMFFADLE